MSGKCGPYNSGVADLVADRYELRGEVDHLVEPVPYAQTICVISLNLSETGPVSRRSASSRR
jgi:hypothetical protein